VRGIGGLYSRDVTARPQLPTAERVADWLASRAAGGGPRPQLGAPQPRPSAFFRRHVLFTVHGSRGVLPSPALPAGSWGTFAFDGAELALLSPDDGSFTRLLRREARPLDEAEPVELAQLVCDLGLPRPPTHRHVVLRAAAELESFTLGRLTGYEVDRRELARARPFIDPPSIVALDEGGWSIAFTTVLGWMHELDDLGVESIWVEPDFTLNIGARRVLSERIFKRLPGVIY
jgi:hypothetical protein